MTDAPKKGGRKKGSLNKTTRLAKDAIALAADRLGGVDRLVAWAQDDPANERVFWGSIYTKLLPLQVNVDGKIDITKVENVIVDPANPDS